MGNLNPSKLQLAETLITHNKLEDARKHLLKICKANKKIDRPWLLLALVDRKLGKLSDAIKRCRHVLQFDPANAWALHLLGSVLHRRGDVQKAISYYEKAIQHNSNLVEAYYFLGNAYRETGDLASAIFNYTKAVTIDKKYLEAMANLGAAFREAGNLSEARNHLYQANTIRPNTPQILCNLALLCMDLDNPEEALAFAEHAYTLNPSFIDTLYVLGSIYSQFGRTDDAIKIYNDILALTPDDPKSKTQLAGICEKRKEYLKSLEMIETLIQSGTYDHETLVTYSRLSDNTDTQLDASNLLLAYLDNSPRNNKGDIDIHYELGRRCDKVGEFDTAFNHYKLANNITREIYADTFAASKFDANRSLLPEWTDRLDRSYWNSVVTSSNNTERPIFIVGMHRSGTTLIEQILSSHSAIHGAGEITTMPVLAKTLQLHPWHNAQEFIESHNRLTTDALNALAAQYLNSDALTRTTEPKVVDNLHYNFFNISLIYRIFPKASIIHITRNAIDNCLSIYFQKFGLTLPYATDLTEIAYFYKRYEALMTYWNQALDLNIFSIKYEDVVNDFEVTSKALVEFCGLKWEEACSEFYNTKRDVNTPSYHQVQKPIYTKSVNRWKNYQAQIQPLVDILGE